MIVTVHVLEVLKRSGYYLLLTGLAFDTHPTDPPFTSQILSRSRAILHTLDQSFQLEMPERLHTQGKQANHLKGNETTYSTPDALGHRLGGSSKYSLTPHGIRERSQLHSERSKGYHPLWAAYSRSLNVEAIR